MSKLHGPSPISDPQHFRTGSEPWCTSLSHPVVGRYHWRSHRGSLRWRVHSWRLALGLAFVIGFTSTFGLVFGFRLGFVFLFGLAFWQCSWSYSGWPSWIWYSWSRSEVWSPCRQHGPAGGACEPARGAAYLESRPSSLLLLLTWRGVRGDGQPTDDGGGDEERRMCDV
jgi:hypothetical protein